MHGGMNVMGRKSRRQVVVVREANGRAQREPQYAASEIRRLRDAAMRGMRDAEWGTELGRLFLEKAITSLMYGAGRRWREEAARYRKSIDAFPVRSVSLEHGIRSTPPDPDSVDGLKQVERDLEAKEKFFEAHSVLVSAGMGAEAAVRRLCEEGKSLAGVYELNSVRAGLLRLADHYRLTGLSKSAMSDRQVGK